MATVTMSTFTGRPIKTTDEIHSSLRTRLGREPTSDEVAIQLKKMIKRKEAHQLWLARGKRGKAEYEAFVAAEKAAAEKAAAPVPVAVEQSLVMPTTKEGVRLWRARLDAIDAAIDALAAAEAAQAHAETQRKAAALNAQNAVATLNRLSMTLPPPEGKEEDEASEDALIPFHHKKVAYLRWGHLDEDGEGVWGEGGDLWLQNADGSKGAYVGQLQANGKIDSSPELIATEPETA